MEDKISIEQGFNICLLFFNYLWESIEPQILKMGDEIAAAHMLFFVSVCMGFESYAEWNQAVFHVTKIPKAEQRKGLKLTLEEVFLCSIAFCKIYNFVFNSRLEFILDLIKDMQIHPDKHPAEGAFWQKAFKDSFDIYVVSEFDWDDQLPR